MAIMEEFNPVKQTANSDVEDDNAYFKRMLDLIPVNFYYAKSQGDILASSGNDVDDNLSGKTTFVAL